MHTEEKSLFKVTKSRLAAGAATVALAASGIGVGVVTAGASTSDCVNAPQSSPLYQSCGDEANASGYGLAVSPGQNGRVGLNDQIVSSNNLNKKTTDFYAHQTNGSASERVFEYAPKGQESGLCISQTSAYAGLTLRYCNGSADQEFYGIGDTQADTSNANGGIQWVNAATGRVIDIGSKKVTTPALASASYDSGTYLHWVG